MPVTGRYLARRFRHSVIPFVRAYGYCVMENVIPSFSHLSERASEVAASALIELGNTEDDCCEVRDAADAAQDRAYVFYTTMTAMRQTSLNLYAAGLFHLLEQQLADMCHDGAFDGPPPSDSKLEAVTKWYHKNFKLDLAKLFTWQKIDHLRLLANSIKHGEGSSSRQLRGICPAIFIDPSLRDLVPIYQSKFVPATRLPLAGQDIFVTTLIFEQFSEAANCFVGEIADYFDTEKDTEFFYEKLGSE